MPFLWWRIWPATFCRLPLAIGVEGIVSHRNYSIERKYANTERRPGQAERWFKRGKQDRHRGNSFMSCPYLKIEAQQEWERGWREANEEIRLAAN